MHCEPSISIHFPQLAYVESEAIAEYDLLVRVRDPGSGEHATLLIEEVSEKYEAEKFPRRDAIVNLASLYIVERETLQKMGAGLPPGYPVLLPAANSEDLLKECARTEAIGGQESCVEWLKKTARERLWCPEAFHAAYYTMLLTNRELWERLWSLFHELAGSISESNATEGLRGCVARLEKLLTGGCSNIGSRPGEPRGGEGGESRGSECGPGECALIALVQLRSVKPDVRVINKIAEFVKKVAQNICERNGASRPTIIVSASSEVERNPGYREYFEELYRKLASSREGFRVEKLIVGGQSDVGELIERLASRGVKRVYVMPLYDFAKSSIAAFLSEIVRVLGGCGGLIIVPETFMTIRNEFMNVDKCKVHKALEVRRSHSFPFDRLEPHILVIEGGNLSALVGALQQ